MKRASIRSALDAERPLVTPLASDALTARLIERARFRAFAIGGSAMLAARYALPDIGLAALGEMADGIRDIGKRRPHRARMMEHAPGIDDVERAEARQIIRFKRGAPFDAPTSVIRAVTPLELRRAGNALRVIVER